MTTDELHEALAGDAPQQVDTPKELSTDSRDVYWFNFDTPEAKGRVGVQRGSYGLEIFLGDEEHRIGLVDLFYQSDEGKRGPQPPHVQLVIDDAYDSEPLVYVKYWPEGGRIYFDHGVRVQGVLKNYGTAYGRDTLRMDCDG